jgi:Protein of unknown function (DUF1499)
MSRSARVAQSGLLLAIAGAVVLALAPLGYRLGWWPLRVSFYYGMGGALVIGAVAVIVSLAGAFLTRGAPAAAGLRLALAGVLIGALVGGYPAAQIAKARRLPPIHDITTDMANPPAFVALAPERRTAPNGLDYAGGKVAQLQAAAYPDVKTLQSALAPAELFARAAKLAVADGWKVAAVVPEDGRIEATATTAMFGFKDDIVIRVEAAEKGSVLDMRSMSRIGQSDVGKNAARIRAFLDQLRAAGA